MKFLKYALASVAAATLMACGGGGSGGGTLAAGADTTVGLNAANGAQIVKALDNLDLSYANGVNDFGTNGVATTLTIADTATATPTFNIASGIFAATGEVGFGSCKFVVKTSTFPALHPLSVGQTITVTPCELVAATSGQAASGVPVESDVKLVLNGAQPEARKLPITITPAGAVQIVTPSGTTISLGTITVVEVTGGA